MMILLCPLALDENNNDAVCAEIFLICKGHLWNKETPSTSLGNKNTNRSSLALENRQA
jgi:hypothetical protein